MYIRPIRSTTHSLPPGAYIRPSIDVQLMYMYPIRQFLFEENSNVTGRVPKKHPDRVVIRQPQPWLRRQDDICLYHWYVRTSALSPQSLFAPRVL